MIKNARLNEFINTIDLYPTFLQLQGKSLMPLLKGEETEWRSHLFKEYHVHANHSPYTQRGVRNDRYKLIWNPLSGIENPGYEFRLSHTMKINEEELYVHNNNPSEWYRVDG